MKIVLGVQYVLLTEGNKWFPAFRFTNEAGQGIGQPVQLLSAIFNSPHEAADAIAGAIRAGMNTRTGSYDGDICRIKGALGAVPVVESSKRPL